MSAAQLMSPVPIPEPLLSPQVRGGQLLFLYFLIFVITATFAGLQARHWEPAWRFAWSLLLFQTLVAAFSVLLSLIVPQMRRSLPVLYVTPRETMSPSDMFLVLGLMVCWAYGLFRLGFIYPLLVWRPEAAPSLLMERYQLADVTFILGMTLAGGVVAPLVEELVFRGYFLNLWRRRFGLWPGILLSSVVFGAGHFWFALFATFAGVIFALVYLRYGSLVPGSLLHGLYNILGGPLVLGPLFAVKPHGHAMELSSWIPEIVLSVAFVPLVIVFWRRFRPRSN